MMSLPPLVLDASVTLAWAFEDEGNAYTDLVLESLAAAFVPNIWPLEVGNALLAAERRGRLNQADSVQFLALLRQLPIVVEAERAELMLGEILALAREQRLSTYDAAYLHLAMRRGFSLATNDEVLRQAATRAGVSLFRK
ncbi:MAG: type II toxin-antitoxin system VapC family toxin [Deltaproteobacteria bacterium]|nr:type II toxin-antitoxin system VapC family toxin [Deltaproteobacteria bacterium]